MNNLAKNLKLLFKLVSTTANVHKATELARVVIGRSVPVSDLLEVAIVALFFSDALDQIHC